MRISWGEKRRLAIAVAAAGLMLVSVSVNSQESLDEGLKEGSDEWFEMMFSAELDEDIFTDELLEEALRAELDDIVDAFELDLDAEYPVDELLPWLLFALGDEGDEGDPYESIISMDELLGEMTEAQTTLEDEVMAALRIADNEGAAALDRPRFMQAAYVVSPAPRPGNSLPPARFLRVAGPRDGAPRLNVALQYTASRVAESIKRR